LRAAGRFDVRVDVDKPGGDDALLGVDRARGGRLADPPDGDDLTAGDGDVGPVPGVAGAVEDTGVADDEVGSRGRKNLQPQMNADERR
jgi:hypothetical protein